MGRWGVVLAIALLPAFSAGALRGAPLPETVSHWVEPDIQGFFDALQDARTPDEAAHIEHDILRIMSRSDSPTVDLLLSRAQAAAEAGDLAAARELLNQSVALAPEFADGWRRRGDVAALRHDYAQAIDDLSQAVKLQPKHFLALQSLGKLHEDARDRDAAIGYYQSALALDPWLLKAQAGLKRLGAAQTQVGAVPAPKAAASNPQSKGGV